MFPREDSASCLIICDFSHRIQRWSNRSTSLARRPGQTKQLFVLRRTRKLPTLTKQKQKLPILIKQKKKLSAFIKQKRKPPVLT